MAAEVTADLTLIQDEDVLRRMWQHTEDFGRKKEIRARMYKLREQRLKDFYTTSEVVSDSALTNIKHTATKHADSIADQGFLSMKTKEIRDSESPTRDIHRRLQADNNYWNTVQESYSTSDEGGHLVDTYERKLAGHEISPDGRTNTQSTAGEKSERSSLLEMKDDSVRQEEQRKQNALASFSSHSKTDDGELSISGSQQEERQKSSSYVTSKTGNTTSYSTSKQESSKSSSSSRQVMSSSTATSSTYKILPSGERVLVSTTTTGSGNRALTGADDNTTNISTDSTSDIRDISNKTYIRNEKTSVSDVNQEKYDNINTRNSYNDNTEFVVNEKYDVTNRDQEFTSHNRSQISRDEKDFALSDQTTQRDVKESSRKEFRNQEITQSEVSNTNVVDQKIMTELQKLDSYLSTQNTTGTSTPVSPRSVTGDAANWTVVSSSNGEFVFRGDTDKQYSPSERPGLIKHPSSLDLPKEATEGQYVTTYQQSYQPKRISVEHSPTHDAFARSLRASPPPTSTRSSSKGSLDRASPERKFKGAGSPTRSSPEKERRVSVAGSYTVEKPKEVKRKVSETLRGTNKDSTTKAKRKFSTTQTKATTKVRSSTPGTSPSTSPTRQDHNATSSSDSESDSSQLTYSKQTETSTLKRKDSLKSTESITKTSRSSPVRSSPERSPPRKSPSPVKTTGILRKDSKTTSSSTIVRSESPVKGKPISPSVSPERVPKESTDKKTNIRPTSPTKKSVSPTIQISSSSVKNQKVQHESTTDKVQRKTSLEKNILQKSSDHLDNTENIPKKHPTISEQDANYTTDRTQTNICISKTISGKKSPDKPGSTDTLHRRSTKKETEINVDVNMDEIQTTNERNGISPRQESPYYHSEPEVDNRKFPEFGVHDTKFIKATTDSKVEVNEFIQTEKDISSTDTESRKINNTSEVNQTVSRDVKQYDENEFPESTPKRHEHPAATHIPDEVAISKADERVHEIAERNLLTQNNFHESTYDSVNIDSSKKVCVETTDFLTNERTEKSPIASPVHLRNQRDKSPEYSSEGSVSKEIKSSRAVFEINKKSPDSSPERSAFKPIKSFRTSPETKQINGKLNEPVHPTGAASPTSPKPSVKESIKQKPTPSPKSRETSPEKSPARPTPSNKVTSSKTSPVRESKSSSISPCSSPERTPVKEFNSSSSPDRRTSKISKSPSASPERKSEKKPRSQPIASESKPSSQQPTEKLPEKKPNNFRTTRRSSIPRAEKKPVGNIKKISEVKIEIKPKPGTNVRVNSFEHKKPDQKNTVPRTVSQGSITKQSTVTKTFKSTATRDITPKSPARTSSATKIKSTAVINVNKPTGRTAAPQPSKTTSNTVINITIAPKKQVTSTITKSTRISDNKKIPINKSNVLKERNIIRKETTTKEQKTVRSNIPHKDDYDGSSDRSTSVSSPETVRPAENEKSVTSNVAIQLICSTDARTNQQFIEHESIKISEQEDTDLENESPPNEFHVEDDEELPAISPNLSIPRATPKTKEKPTVTKQAPVTPKKPLSSHQSTGSVKTTLHLKQPAVSVRPVANSIPKTTPVKLTPTKKTGPQTPLKQKISSESLTRTQSDRSISKSTVVKKDTIKVDTTRTQSKIAPRRITTETGVASKHVSTPKSATIKTSPKKKPLKRDTSPSSSSSSSDEETEVDIPSNVSIISQDEQYINELEEIRRREEQEYASKLTATTTQEDSLLNVIIQHPKSSRESSPGYSSYDQPICTVSDDGGSRPRYADLISEPEDVEVFDIPGKKSTIREPYETYPTQKQPKFEQVTDLDDGSDTEEKLNVSVADRVSQFLESTKEANTVKTTSTISEDITEGTKEGPKAVLKAKQMFETIAKNQTAPPAPGNKPVDILSRPSVFEARRGITTPKDKFETIPRERTSESPEPVKMINSNQEIIDETKFSSSNEVKISSASVIREKSISPEREIPNEKPVSARKPEKQKPASPYKPDSAREKSQSPARDEPIRRKSPSPAKEVSAKKPVSDSTKLILSETKDHKSKSSEVNIKQSNHISSKRDFFEQKAKTEQTVSKGRPSSRGPTTPLKTRPVTSGKKVPDSRTETLSFIENEKISSPRSSPDRKTTRPSSPSKKPEKTPLAKSSAVKSTSIEKEDEGYNSTTVTRKISRDSPDRKISSPHPKDKKEPIRPSSPTKDKKESLRSISPTKEVRESVRPVSPTKNKRDRSSPEKQFSSTKPERRDSINKQKSPERTVKKESVREKSPVKSSSPPREVKERSPERILTKERKSSLKRSSPERKISVETKTITEKHEYARKDSSDREILVQQNGDVVELNRAGRFGVTLRRTSSTSSAGTPRRTSMPGGDEIEDIFQLELLEQMLEKAVGYEQRRHIRAQIRIVKKLQEEAQSALKPTKSPGREVQSYAQQPANRKPEAKKHVPEKKPQVFEPTEDKKPEIKKIAPVKKTSVSDEIGVRKVITDEIEINKTEIKRTEPDQKPSYQRAASPTKQRVETHTRIEIHTRSPQQEVKPVDTVKKSPVSLKQETSPVRQQDVIRKGSKTESTTITSSTVRTPVREREPCPITSSYGVGPTDEHGRPLFGLKALRRSNTSKTLTDEVVEQEHREHKQEVEVTETEEICDARGRPLFGLKALQVSSVDTQEMPEVSSTQLRGLVEKHEQQAREHTTVDSQPRQKPKARLRDSFILQSQDEDTVEDNQQVTSTTTTTTLSSTSTPQQRGGVSLRSLIQKHEGVSSSGGKVHREMESKTTVVTSKSTMSSDGSVSLSQDVIKGELSSKNGEEPSGKITHTKYSYQTPDVKNKTQGISSTTTTTTSLGGRRVSGPKITEIEDSEERRSSVTSESSSRRFSGTKIVDYEEIDSSKMTKDLDESSQQKFSSSSSRRLSQDVDEGTTTTTSGGSNFVTSAIKKFSGPNKTDEDNRLQKKSTTVSSAKFISSTSSLVKKSNINSNSTVSSSSSPVADTKTKTVSSSISSTTSSVQKQKDVDNEEEDKKKPLIRGDSVRALQHKFQQATVASSLKQHSSSPESPKQKQTSQLSPVSRLSEKQEKSVVSNEGSVSSSRTVETSSTSRVTTEKTSFLDNTTKVSGVQDILNRMRNADLVVESGDTTEDQEARALLNKFLGASVILQGMEQGMKANQQQHKSNGHHSLPASPTSATLVSRVEKQRMASATSQHQDFDDLENIWDEKQLRNLLEDCSDYDGRRKIRARLRNVMAEHKACADVMAVASDVSGNSVLSQECVESKQLSTKVDESSYTHSEVHTRTSSTFATSQHRVTKANSVTSPFQKFKQLERQNSVPSRSPSDTPLFKFTDPKVARSASTIKDRLLSWVQAQTKDYKNIQIDNFSTSWNNGLAFCALIHHFCPEAFDYDKLTPEKRRHNFELAFRVAEEEADIAPLLDVEDMVVMRRPDWKCVFTYVQSVYRRFHSTPEAVRP